MRLPTICEKCSECSDQLGSDTSSCMITIVYIIRALHDQLSYMEKDKYQNQNNELKQLHFQRMARRLQAKAQQATQQPKPQGKRIAPMQNQSQTTKNPNQIYLNSIIYDKRSPEQKNHNVSLINFMHPSFQVSTRVVSKEVEAIMITTYGFETEVFEPIVQTGVPFYVFNRDGEGRQGKIYRNYSGYGNMTVISPPKHQQGYGVFHTKLWLIKFKQFLRVVVCTSNNHLYDWTIWQNAYWYHDCPLKDIKEQSKIEKSGENKSKEKSTEFDNEKDFVQTLKWVIDNMQPSKFDILKEMKVELQNYSFKGINAILIPSLPGRFKGEQLDKIGLGKIRKILKNRQQKMKEPTITINCTSLGKLDEKFIRQVYSSFCPSEGFMNPQKFKLIYPSQLYIENQTCGEAGTLCLVPQNYAKCELKKQIFYKYQQSYFNGVQGGIPHLKTVIVQQKPGQNIVLYIGSHNLTKAAWGTFQKQQSQINCLNEQLGLLFLDYSQDELLRWLPYRYPPEKYSSSDLPYMRTRQ